jgi:HK97 family phage prohead protease
MTNPQHYTASRHADAIAFVAEEADIAAGRIVGTACHFGRQNLNGWSLAIGSLDRWLADFQRAGRKLPMLWGHDPSEQIGSFDAARIEGERLVLTGRLNLDVQRAKEVRALILAGDTTGLSVGVDADMKDVERSRGGLVFRTANLMETSVVGMPADTEARISMAASASSITTRAAFERFLKRSGFSGASASGIAARGWSGVSKATERAAESTQSTNELLAKIAAATAEITNIRKDY